LFHNVIIGKLLMKFFDGMIVTIQDIRIRNCYRRIDISIRILILACILANSKIVTIRIYPVIAES